MPSWCRCRLGAVLMPMPSWCHLKKGCGRSCLQHIQNECYPFSIAFSHVLRMKWLENRDNTHAIFFCCEWIPLFHSIHFIRNTNILLYSIGGSCTWIVGDCCWNTSTSMSGGTPSYTYRSFISLDSYACVWNAWCYACFAWCGVCHLGMH